jgi:hypothetical protein
MTIAPTTTTDPDTSSRQPGLTQTPAIGRTFDGPAAPGTALNATSRIHNRAGITMLVVAACRFPQTVGSLIRVPALDTSVVSRGA